MNYRIFTLLLSILFLNTLSFAQSRSAQDEASASSIDPVSFDKARFNLVTVGGKKWIRVSVKPLVESKALASGESWWKDVEVNLLCAFEDDKKQLQWFSSDVKFYALERNVKNYVLNFYIPAEYVSMYNLRPEPKGYLIELKANGKDYPLNAKNYKDRSNLSATNVKSFMDAASDNTSSNSGIMSYFEDAPFIVQYNDIPSGLIPTSAKKK